MNFLTDAERRHAAHFTSDIWKHEFQRLRRRPEAWEVVISARVAAAALTDGANRHQLPRLRRSPLVRLLYGPGGSDIEVSEDLAAQARATLSYIAAAGDKPKSSQASVDRDRLIFDLATDMFCEGGVINDSEIARQVGVSHTVAWQRKAERGSRIVAALHRDCPSIWGPDAPMIEKIVAPDEGATLWRQAA